MSVNSKPFKLRTVTILSLLVLLGVGGFYGYKAVLNYASDKMVDQVAKQVLTEDEIKTLLEDPEVKKLVEQAEKGINKTTVDTTPTPESSGVDPNLQTDRTATETNGVPQQKQESGAPRFANKEEAFQFLLSKFSMSEIREVMGMASGGLTEEEKEKIKASLLSRLTPEEYQALIITGLIEMKKQ